MTILLLLWIKGISFVSDRRQLWWLNLLLVLDSAGFFLLLFFHHSEFWKKEIKFPWFIFEYYWESTSRLLLSHLCCSLISSLLFLFLLLSPHLTLLLKTHLLHKSKESSSGCRIITKRTQLLLDRAAGFIKSINLRCICQYNV